MCFALGTEGVGVCALCIRDWRGVVGVWISECFAAFLI